MSSAGFTRRRGLRAIVSREVAGSTATLALECGHSVTRPAHTVVCCQSAVCKACVKADGAARDEARKAGGVRP
jgi:hypothetical protein